MRANKNLSYKNTMNSTTKEFYWEAKGEYRRSSGAKRAHGHIFPGQIARPSDDHKDICEFAKHYFKSLYPRTSVVEVEIHEVCGIKGNERKHFSYKF